MCKLIEKEEISKQYIPWILFNREIVIFRAVCTHSNPSCTLTPVFAYNSLTDTLVYITNFLLPREEERRRMQFEMRKREQELLAKIKVREQLIFAKIKVREQSPKL